MPSPLPAAWRRDAPWLIAAVAGRALAASARRAGLAAVVLDLFADRDTRELGYPCRNVARADALRFDRGRLLAAADELAPAGACAGVVVGSGFEGATRLMAGLAKGRRIAGNTPAAVAAVKDPARFFTLLLRLGLPCPDTQTGRPADPRGWLAKRRGGAGGTHVVPAASARAGRDTYFQRFESGRSLSVLFLADGRRASVVGFNEQWTADVAGRSRFLYAGGMGGMRLDAGLEAEIAEALDRLADASGLVGLNGLDFVETGAGWSILEINPRPTAALEHYDEDWPGGLFAAHLAACEGRLPETRMRADRVRGHAVLYAKQPLAVGPAIRFPAWCRDIPNPGTLIPAGAPVCTVHGGAADHAELTALIRQRSRSIEQDLIGKAA